MQSGRGDQASDGTYRPLPIPREPQTPAVPEAREGVVLPAHGEQWDGPTQVVQPAVGQPWGPSAQSADAPQPQQPAAHPQMAHPHAQADGEATQLIAPYGQVHDQGYGAGHGSDAEKTQLISPYQQQAQQPVEHTQQLRPPARMPLPPEQEFRAPVPPLPEQPPAPPPSPPMPQAAPYAIRPGAPGDHPSVPLGHQQETAVLGRAAATQQLPRIDEAWQSQSQSQSPSPSPEQGLQQSQPQPQDDYDFLYRRNDEAVAPPTRTMPPVPPSYGGPSQPRQQPHPQLPRKKLSTRAVVGIAVAACAVVGLTAGALFGAGGNGSDQQKAGSAASATTKASSGAGANAAAAQQAQSLDALLGQSGSSRTTVINAVQSIKDCGNLAAAAADLRGAAGQRDALVSQLSQLSLDQLPSHSELVSQLTMAWKSSAAADQHYAQWADQMARDKNGCRKGHSSPTPQMQQGNASSGEATYAKQQAAALWNPIARQYGLTQRQYSQL
ncbi:hypothetical protein NGB36_08895 [Streptomyces sp. RB6PN25]|uniref:Uncharacterized protein n=1 Tax=Streptomyces humicola TaxID=2953240 RepID=A0ABT1PSR3_9ACTN|nr:hypothetical protein [Streptomyces humicola]MCQ4080716.1 hypothetical protein [Streptomyces humicola]